MARCLVWGLFLTTLVLLGPRAYGVVAARVQGQEQAGPAVDLDRVGFCELPAWLDGPLLLAVSRDLEPWLQDGLPLLDDDGVRRLQAGLRTVPWVRELTLERVFPDRFRARLDLRQPVLAVRSDQGEPICLCDRDGVALPYVELPLPATFLFAEGGATTLRPALGEKVTEERVLAAVAVALEWRDEFAPLVPGCPELVEVDATNLGERFAQSPRYAEIRVRLRRNDGAAVLFAYDRPPQSPLPRIPTATKAEVLRKILAAYPGLQGLVAGDLRFSVRWQDWLQPRSGPDPAGPWGDK